ncbi:hypothetical protein IFR04_004417 [Cadophora malorum]|uniref:Uncharacterized protein n=1 Tax=Cadophora malorum TaxID=108018 RepID=A0A8H8BSV8_9HELO|nr:hypothetical protein IFR04_004417 [Cadophora malorum]
MEHSAKLTFEQNMFFQASTAEDEERHSSSLQYEINMSSSYSKRSHEQPETTSTGPHDAPAPPPTPYPTPPPSSLSNTITVSDFEQPHRGPGYLPSKEHGPSTSNRSRRRRSPSTSTSTSTTHSSSAEFTSNATSDSSYTSNSSTSSSSPVRPVHRQSPRHKHKDRAAPQAQSATDQNEGYGETNRKHQGEDMSRRAKSTHLSPPTKSSGKTRSKKRNNESAKLVFVKTADLTKKTSSESKKGKAVHNNKVRSCMLDYVEGF